jgi:hypothetical protein
VNQYNVSPTIMGQTPPTSLVMAKRQAPPRTHAIWNGMWPCAIWIAHHSHYEDQNWGVLVFLQPLFVDLPLLENCKNNLIRDGLLLASLNKSDFGLVLFLCWHDMENMHMWVLKEKPENALGNMQLRNYMNWQSCIVWGTPISIYYREGIC